ncbi:MAG: hypothetical protein IKT40_05100 [Bacilli bacterium]|jgi:endoglucanase|nr:hypothetical protein [Bacilli bacterium]
MYDRKLLETLLSIHSPSGYELELQKALIKETKDIFDEVITQNNYNVIHVLNPKSETKILLAAHIDEVGMIINKINANGTCRLQQIGGSRPYMYAGQQVVVLTDNGEVPGIIGYLPNMDKGIQAQDLILDLGCQTEEEAKQLVRCGNPVMVDRKYTYLANNFFSGKALDDKLAAYIFLEAIKKVKGKTNLGIYLATTVGEETTGRGAHVAVQKVKPTCAITMDVTYAACINYRENLLNDVYLGKGAVLTEGSLMNKVMHKQFLDICKEKQIPYQIETAPSRTYTDTDSMYTYFEGVPCYLLSIPLRYMHSSVEVCNFNDVDNLIDLVAEYILQFDPNKSFNPFEE